MLAMAVGRLKAAGDVFIEVSQCVLADHFMKIKTSLLDPTDQGFGNQVVEQWERRACNLFRRGAVKASAKN